MKTAIKRLLSLFLTFVLIFGYAATGLSGLGCCFFPVLEAAAADINNLTFAFDGDTAEITDCDEQVSGTLEIPAVVEGKKVISVGNNAFEWCKSLECVKLPDGITSIGSNAFDGCTSLKSINIPETVRCVGSRAFKHCISLSDIVLPDTVEVIGAFAFFGSKLYNVSGNWENGVLYIGHHLIASKPGEINGIYQATNGTRSIADGAFCGCSSLVGIELPESVHFVAAAAFDKCEKLTDINAAEGNASYLSDNGVLFNKSKTELVCYPAGKPEKLYRVPDGVTVVGKGAFSGCFSLTSIELSNSTESIGENAFSGCKSLENMTFGSAVARIGRCAFVNCARLGAVEFSDSVISVSERAFEGCSLLKSVRLSDNLTFIGDYAFHNCGEIGSITIPGGVHSVGCGVFENCSGLSSVKILYGIMAVGSRAFYGCASLSDIELPESLTSVGSEAFENCGCLTHIVIPDSVSTIGERSFSGCSLLGNVTVGKGVTSIGKGAFSGCISLRHVLYAGSEKDWEKVIVGDGNESLTDAGIQFKLYTVVWKNFDGSVLETDDNVPFGTLPEYNGKTPEKAAVAGQCCVFSGWLPEISRVTEDAVYTADFTEKTAPCTVTWVVDGERTTESYKPGDTIVRPADPEKEGYVFIGWTPEFFAAMPARDVTFTAVFEEKEYTVTWNIGGKKTTASYKQGEAITKPDDPEKDGYVFKGWAPDVPGTMPAKDLVFTAVFAEKEYTVTWDIDGRETVEKYKRDETIVKPVDPVKEGFAFKGWTHEIPEKMPAKNLKFTAVFERQEYTVTWNTDGEITTEIYEYGEPIENPCDPVNGVYSFVGWEPEIPKTMPAGDLTFFAVFEIKQDGFSYEFSDGRCSLTSYGENAAGAIAVTQSVDGKPLTEIGSGVFENNLSLTGVVLPKNISKIGEKAFSGCEKITSVELYKSVKEIGEGAFEGCSVLSDIFFEGSKAEWKRIVIASGNDKLHSAVIHFDTVMTRRYAAGDINGNGKITAADARLALRAAVGLESGLRPRRQIAADVDGSHGITAADARLILRIAVGLEIPTDKKRA